MPTTLVPLARAAGLIETGPHVRSAVAGWGYDLNTVRTADGVEEAVAHGIFEDLRSRGLCLGVGGVPCPATENEASDPELLRPPALGRHVLATLLREAARSRYKALYDAANDRAQTRLLSAGGPTAGKSLTAPASLQQAHFGDVVFSQILQWRLGTASSGPREPGSRATCRNATHDGELCGEVLDADGDHAACCPCGPLRTKRHDELAEDLGEMIAETGAHVRREAAIIEFNTVEAEALMDLWAFGGREVHDLLVDVTIRHPAAPRYQPAAAASEGVAAAAVADEKHKRYPSKAGRCVRPFAAESWGRLEAAAEELLETLAAAATRHARLCGQAPAPGGYWKR